MCFPSFLFFFVAIKTPVLTKFQTMKKVMTTLIIALITTFCYAPGTNTLMVFVTDPIRPYEKIWEATCKYESNNDPYAIGDKHLRHKSYGVAQIRQVRLDDYFKRTGIRYTTKDMFDPVKSKEIFMYYASGSDMEAIARKWNGGDRGMQKKSTIKYWKQIQKRL